MIKWFTNRFKRGNGIYLTREAYENVKDVMVAWSEGTPRYTEELLFDKIVEFMEEQKKRLTEKCNRLSHMSEDAIQSDQEYIEYDEAIMESSDWDMMMKDVA